MGRARRVEFSSVAVKFASKIAIVEFKCLQVKRIGHDSQPWVFTISESKHKFRLKIKSSAFSFRESSDRESDRSDFKNIFWYAAGEFWEPWS